MHPRFCSLSDGDIAGVGCQLHLDGCLRIGSVEKVHVSASGTAGEKNGKFCRQQRFQVSAAGIAVQCFECISNDLHHGIAAVGIEIQQLEFTAQMQISAGGVDLHLTINLVGGKYVR